MVDKLCCEFGNEIVEFESQLYYDFPTIDRLAAKGVEQRLRELGFGYRAKYISKTAQMLNDMDDKQWLYNLRQLPYDEARKHLLTLSGVGPKVADCVCLMSLDKADVIPIDTHVLQIAKRSYGFKHDSKTITQKSYKLIGDFFRALWGDYAGWAQSVMFSADLKIHQEKQPSSPTKDLKRKQVSKEVPAAKISRKPRQKSSK